VADPGRAGGAAHKRTALRSAGDRGDEGLLMEVPAVQ
jgi:hypothetical protein